MNVKLDTCHASRLEQSSDNSHMRERHCWHMQSLSKHFFVQWPGLKYEYINYTGPQRLGMHMSIIGDLQPHLPGPTCLWCSTNIRPIHNVFANANKNTKINMLHLGIGRHIHIYSIACTHSHSSKVSIHSSACDNIGHHASLLIFVVCRCDAALSYDEEQKNRSA